MAQDFQKITVSVDSDSSRALSHSSKMNNVIGSCPLSGTSVDGVVSENVPRRSTAGVVDFDEASEQIIGKAFREDLDSNNSSFSHCGSLFDGLGESSLIGDQETNETSETPFTCTSFTFSHRVDSHGAIDGVDSSDTECESDQHLSEHDSDSTKSSRRESLCSLGCRHLGSLYDGRLSDDDDIENDINDDGSKALVIASQGSSTPVRTASHERRKSVRLPDETSAVRRKTATAYRDSSGDVGCSSEQYGDDSDPYKGSRHGSSGYERDLSGNNNDLQHRDANAVDSDDLSDENSDYFNWQSLCLTECEGSRKLVEQHALQTCWKRTMSQAHRPHSHGTPPGVQALSNSSDLFMTGGSAADNKTFCGIERLSSDTSRVGGPSFGKADVVESYDITDSYKQTHQQEQQIVETSSSQEHILNDKVVGVTGSTSEIFEMRSSVSGKLVASAPRIKAGKKVRSMEEYLSRGESLEYTGIKHVYRVIGSRYELEAHAAAAAAADYAGIAAQSFCKVHKVRDYIIGPTRIAVNVLQSGHVRGHLRAVPSWDVYGAVCLRALGLRAGDRYIKVNGTDDVGYGNRAFRERPTRLTVEFRYGDPEPYEEALREWRHSNANNSAVPDSEEVLKLVSKEVYEDVLRQDYDLEYDEYLRSTEENRAVCIVEDQESPPINVAICSQKKHHAK